MYRGYVILDEAMTYDENESMELEMMWLSVMNERNSAI